MTARLLDGAGLGGARHVLDVGCGPGAVTRMIADRLGPNGHVTGVDIDLEMIERAAARPHPRASFRLGGFDTPPPAAGFDAAIGRRVLMYVPDPAAALEALARSVRPGGIVAFHEHAWDEELPDGPPLHAEVRRWQAAMLRTEGASSAMGRTLAPALEAAGLEVMDVAAELNVLTAAQDGGLPSIVDATWPRIVSCGAAIEAAIGRDTLAERLAVERRAHGAPIPWEEIWLVLARVVDGSAA